MILVTGVASFLPIFFYTFFLFILTSNDLAETLPKRLKNVAKLSLILFVPAIIIFNEIASFVGVIIRKYFLTHVPFITDVSVQAGSPLPKIPPKPLSQSASQATVKNPSGLSLQAQRWLCSSFFRPLSSALPSFVYVEHCWRNGG